MKNEMMLGKEFDVKNIASPAYSAPKAPRRWPRQTEVDAVAAATARWLQSRWHRAAAILGPARWQRQSNGSVRATHESSVERLAASCSSPASLCVCVSGQRRACVGSLSASESLSPPSSSRARRSIAFYSPRTPTLITLVASPSSSISCIIAAAASSEILNVSLSQSHQKRHE